MMPPEPARRGRRACRRRRRCGAWTCADGPGDVAAASLPSEPSGPGGRPSARAAAARCARPRGGLRRGVRAAATCWRTTGSSVDGRALGPLGDQVGPAGPLRVPLVGLEVLGRLGLAASRTRPSGGRRRTRGRADRRRSRARGPGWSSATAPAVADVADDVGRRARGRRSRNTSLNEAWPFIWRSGRTSTPGWCIVEREVGDAAVLGHVPVGAGEQHARSRRGGRCVFHTFWPLTTHSSPSRSARVVRPARSEPLPGSLNSWHHVCSPVTIGRQEPAPSARRCRARGSSARRGRCRPRRRADARRRRQLARPRRGASAPAARARTTRPARSGRPSRSRRAARATRAATGRDPTPRRGTNGSRSGRRPP